MRRAAAEGKSSPNEASDANGAPGYLKAKKVPVEGAAVQQPNSSSKSPPSERTLSTLAKPKTARKAKKKKNRPAAHTTAAADHGRELTTNGYAIEGPIASGAFSTVLRARVQATNLQVAIKSFDEAKCKKSRYLAYARDCELSVLRGLRHYAACVYAHDNGLPPPAQLVIENGVVQPREEARTARPSTALYDKPDSAQATNFAADAEAANAASSSDGTGGGVANEGDPTEVMRELQKGGHPHIANLVDELVGPAATHAILEYCAGGSLDYYLTSLRKKKKMGGSFAYLSEDGMREEEVAPLMRQMADGLQHLHKLGVAHRDMKPANVLFYDTERTHLKICDFGFAIRCGDKKMRDRLGTLIYKAPELCKLKGDGGYLGRPLDMWALGAILYEMLHTRPAFHGNTEQDIEIRICQSGGYNDLRRSLSSAAKSVVQGLLSIDVSTRLTAEEVLGSGWIVRASSRPLPVPDVTSADAAEAEDDGGIEEDEGDENDGDEAPPGDEDGDAADALADGRSVAERMRSGLMSGVVVPPAIADGRAGGVAVEAM